jgi:hypothetical protein
MLRVAPELEMHMPHDQHTDRHGDQNATERSGEFSHDPLFDPAELFLVLEQGEGTDRMLEAMREFVRRADVASLERAVALYARSARARGEPVEAVLAALESLADDAEGSGAPGFAQRDTPLRHAVMRRVLLAFYGPVVRRGASARNRARRAHSADTPHEGEL